MELRPAPFSSGHTWRLVPVAFTLLASLVAGCKAPELARTLALLDNSMVLYGSGISDGDRHDHINLPVVLLGKGGGTMRTGQHLKCPQDTPMCNLLLAMLRQAGLPINRFGDSTELLPGLLA